MMGDARGLPASPGGWYTLNVTMSVRLIQRSRRLRRALLAGGAIVIGAAVTAVTVRPAAAPADCCPGAEPPRLGDPIAATIDVAIDSLANGLRYYVHRTGGDRVELRLVVDAGSVHEDADQRGLAHAVEHMTFRGTRSWPGGAIERYFESIGMRPGDDVNATTSLDETVFRVTIPAARPAAVDTALAMLASLAHEARFDADDARLEAGVLLAEWRTSRDAYARVSEARWPLLYAGTPYVERPVLGDTGVLRQLDVGAMRRFYETWYVPTRMAVVVVGDLEADVVGEMMERHFGVIPRRGGGAAPAAAPRQAPARGIHASVVADAEARNSWIGAWFPSPRSEYRTRADYRESVVGALWRGILAGRVEDLALAPASPVAAASVERRRLARALTADVVSVTAMKGRTLDAMDALVAALDALATEGPTESELAERRDAMLGSMRGGAAAGDAAADLAEEFVDHFLTGAAVITARGGYELTRDLLPTITPADVRAYARERSSRGQGVVIVAATPDDPAAAIGDVALAGRLKAANGRNTIDRSAPVDVARMLAGSAPSPGRIVSETAVPEARAYEWVLSNGMHVILKPASFTFDEVQVLAMAPGGASLASPERYASAYLSDAIIEETGVGQIPAVRLARWLESTSVTVDPYVAHDAISLSGRAAPDDLEALFQLMHLHLTAPRRDTVAFRRYHERMQSVAADRRRDPVAVYRDTIGAIFGRGRPGVARDGARFYDGLRLDHALDFWRQRTANGSGFTVAIVGDFTLARVRPLAERYLASLPAGTPETPRPDSTASTPAPGHRMLGGGMEDRARTHLGFTGPIELTSAEFDAVGAVREVIAMALTQRLRARMGGAYHVDVRLEIDPVPPARYTMGIDFESAPETMEPLVAAARDELARLRRDGPTEDAFRNTREARIRDFDARLDDNAWWADELVYHAQRGWPLAGIALHQRDAEAMTIDAVRRACATYIPAGGFVRVTMRPPEQAAASATGPR